MFAGSATWLFWPKKASQKRLQTNALKWLANGKANPKIAFRSKRGDFKRDDVAEVPMEKLAEKAGEVDIYGLNGWKNMTDAEIDAVVKFVEGGGSLIFADHARSFSDDKASRTMEWPGNRLELLKLEQDFECTHEGTRQAKEKHSDSINIQML